LLAADVLGRLVLAKPLIGRRAEVAVVRPLDELDLADELRLDPPHVALSHLGHLGHDLERRALALERLQLLQEPPDLGVREPGAAVADICQLCASLNREHERTKRSRAPALALRVAGDDELLAVLGLDLQPVARALALCVLRVEPLRDDPLEPLLTRRLEQRLAVVEALRELDNLV